MDEIRPVDEGGCPAFEVMYKTNLCLIEWKTVPLKRTKAGTQGRLSADFSGSWGSMRALL